MDRTNEDRSKIGRIQFDVIRTAQTCTHADSGIRMDATMVIVCTQTHEHRKASIARAAINRLEQSIKLLAK